MRGRDQYYVRVGEEHVTKIIAHEYKPSQCALCCFERNDVRCQRFACEAEERADGKNVYFVEDRY